MVNCSEIGQIPRKKGYSNIIKYRIPAHCPKIVKTTFVWIENKYQIYV